MFCVYIQFPGILSRITDGNRAFYGKGVRKLVAAGELEWQARDQFDTAFSKSLLRLAASAA